MHDLVEEHCNDELAGLACPTLSEHVSNPTITNRLIEYTAATTTPPMPHPIFQEAIQPQTSATSA
jgi:hypothetical protein